MMHKMEDPYKILGISPSASKEELSRAYHKLVKKYHPDLHPGDKAAEQKMRQINAAYEQIKTQKTGGASYEQPDGSYGPQRHDRPPGGGYTYRGDDPFGGFDFGGFGDIFDDLFGQGWEQQGSGQQGSGAPSIQQARLLIQIRQYREALRILSQMPEHSAEWHYLSAIAHAGVGSRVTALNYAKEAVRLEPGNVEYERLLNQFLQGGFTYRQTGQSYGFNMQNLARGILEILLLQLLCLFCCRCC